MSDDRTLDILLLEDTPAEAELIHNRLRRDGLDFICRFVDSREGYESALAAQPPDVILADYVIPGYDGLAALRYAREIAPEVPFILVSGRVGEEFAVESLQSGAADYVLKSNLIRLPSAVVRARTAADERALRRQADERLYRQAQLMRDVLESISHPFMVLDADEYIVSLSNSAARSGKALTEATTCHMLTHGLDSPCSGQEEPCPLELIRESLAPETVEHIHQDADIGRRFIEVHGFPILDEEGRLAHIIEYHLDITERRSLEELLIERERQLQTAYADVLNAATQGKLVLASRERFDSVPPGERLAEVEVTDGLELEAGIETMGRILAAELECVRANDEVVLSVCEAMANGLKHAGGCHVSVMHCPSESGPTIKVLVEDDGPGIDFSELPNAMMVAGYSTMESLGMGFTLMLATCDRLTVATDQHGTSIALEFFCQHMGSARELMQA